jgi:hypothetical protein
VLSASARRLLFDDQIGLSSLTVLPSQITKLVEQGIGEAGFTRLRVGEGVIMSHNSIWWDPHNLLAQRAAFCVCYSLGLMWINWELQPPPGVIYH